MKARTEIRKLVLNHEEVNRILPHRPPMKFVHTVTAWDPETRILVAEYRVSQKACLGHFPDNPVFPGAKMVEGLGQSAYLALALFNRKKLDGRIPAVVRVKEVVWYNPVAPGDLVHYEIVLNKVRREGVVFSGTALVERTKVASVKEVMLWLLAERKKALC